MFTFRPFIAFDPNTDGGGDPNQPGAAPWASDLQSRFTDDGVRGQVDAYLRESWQPRMTKLEQDLAGRPDVPAEAATLFNDLMADPQKTVTDLIEELYGDPDFAAMHNPALVEGWRNLLTPKEEAAVDKANAAIEAGKTPTKLTMDQLPDEVREVYDAHLKTVANEQKTTYETTVRNALKTDEAQKLGMSEEDYAYVHPFIQNAGGNLDQAFGAYAAYRDALRGGASKQQAEQEAAEAAKPTPPVTLGAGGAVATATPPTEKKYSWNQMGDAVSDWLAEERKGPPPVVGSV